MEFPKRSRRVLLGEGRRTDGATLPRCPCLAGATRGRPRVARPAGKPGPLSSAISVSLPHAHLQFGVSHLVCFCRGRLGFAFGSRMKSRSALVFLPALPRRFFTRELRTPAPLPHVARLPPPETLPPCTVAAWISTWQVASLLEAGRAESLQPQKK